MIEFYSQEYFCKEIFMSYSQDPIAPICKKAMTYPGVIKGVSCNQTSFKVGKSKFLFIGPGAKGQGFKAMFKLKNFASEAMKMAEKEPNRYQVSATSGWVTVRFTAENPLSEVIWEKWLKESYELSCS